MTGSERCRGGLRANSGKQHVEAMRITDRLQNFTINHK
jgi:hypothetical protein